ncbi:MAG: hypothetical protein AB2421_12325, partial [Thermotaleaceae bacterium]
LENIVELSSMDVQFKKLLYQLIEVPEEKHNKDVVLSSIEQLAHLPQDMLAYLVDQKTKIRFINGFITEEPEVQDIYDEEKNIHIRDVDGVYVIESNLILLRILEKDTPLTMLHEIGHAYEWLTKKLYSQSPEFIEIWALEAERVFKRKNKESSYWYKHPDEYFAEFFTSYFTIDAYRFSWDSHHSKEELKKIAPLTYDLFDKEIAVFNYDAKKQIGQPIKKAVNR